MNYTESYTLFAGSQLLPELDIADVQLPGSDLLLPSLDGYLAEPTTTSSQKIKHHPDGNHLFDFNIDDDYWRNLGVAIDCLGDDSGLDPGELLPSSPEATSCDLNSIDFDFVGHNILCKEQDVFSGIPDRTANDQTACPTSAAAQVVESMVCNATGDLLDEDGCLGDFDPKWLLQSEPSLPSVSVDLVDSILSASPLFDGGFMKEKWDISGAELETQVTDSQLSPVMSPIASSHIDNLQLSADQLILFSNCPGQMLVRACPSLANDINWIGGGAVGTSLLHGFESFDGSLAVTAVPDLGLSPVQSPRSDIEPISTLGPIATKSANSVVRVEPYPTSGVKPERKERKREQNKTAAIKYRQKKRSEKGVFVSECEQLEKRNVELKSRAEELTREINYLKGLISEIYSNQSE